MFSISLMWLIFVRFYFITNYWNSTESSEIKKIILSDVNMYEKTILYKFCWLGDRETMRGLREGMDRERLVTKMAEGCKIIEDQTAQEDWYRIDTSRYCPEYGEWKK